MEKELEELGLTRNESKIYIFLLKNCETTTGSIIKETKIANSRVYESLNSLIEKSLVTYNIQRDGKHFKAAEPDVLKEKERERKEKIEKIVPLLHNLISEKEDKTTTSVYEGFEGFKTAFKRIIDDCEVGGTIQVLGFSQPEYKSENLNLFLNNINLKSIEKKQKLKIISDISSKNFQKDIAKAKNSEIRYMPKGYISPAAIDIFQDYAYIFMWEEKPYVFMIKNKQIADSFKTYFEFLWKIAKP
jgi:sugar-specific transcriptional regulator TrmB